MSVSRILCRVALCLTICVWTTVAQQDTPEQKKQDTFFAGTVTEWNAEKISVSRTVSGKAESRTFRITSDTKVEGKQKVKVRVTVRYVSDDDGERATLIVVRTTQPKPK
jgi:hypothetical protein